MEKTQIQKDIAVVYVAATSFPQGIEAAFKKLEEKLPAKEGRTFFGISWSGKNGEIIYKAAAEQKQQGEAAEPGLDSFIIKKGTYASVLIKDFMKDTSQVGRTFKELLKHPDLDPDGYCLEWYKSNKDVLCMVKLVK